MQEIKGTRRKQHWEQPSKHVNKKLFDLLMSLAHKDEIREYTNSHVLIIQYAVAINSGESEFIDAMLALVSNREECIPFDRIFYQIANYKPVRHTDASKVYDALHAVVERHNAWENLSGPKLKGGGNYLVRACYSKNPNVLSFLLQHTNPKEWHAKDRVSGRTPIFSAIRSRSVECVQLLLKYGGAKIAEDFDKQENGPLSEACKGLARYADDGMVKVFLPYSMSHLNNKNASGNTPLHCALNMQFFEPSRTLLIIQPLLGTGAIDFSIRNNEGKTVFDLAYDPLLLSAIHSAANRKKGEASDLDDTSKLRSASESAPPADPCSPSPP